MADWTFTPIDRSGNFGDDAPETLITKLSDGKDLSLEIGTVFLRTWSERYRLSATDADSARDFWRLKGLHVAFTKKTLDPKDAGGTETNVKFARAPEWTDFGPTHWDFTVVFREVIV